MGIDNIWYPLITICLACLMFSGVAVVYKYGLLRGVFDGVTYDALCCNWWFCCSKLFKILPNFVDTICDHINFLTEITFNHHSFSIREEKTCFIIDYCHMLSLNSIFQIKATNQTRMKWNRVYRSTTPLLLIIYIIIYIILYHARIGHNNNWAALWYLCCASSIVYMLL